MPHIEGDEEDVKSRHKGKLETESYLKKIGIPFTSIRPTYIYGAGNYNPLEEWFFTRLDQGARPINDYRRTQTTLLVDHNYLSTPPRPVLCMLSHSLHALFSQPRNLPIPRRYDDLHSRTWTASNR